MSSGYRYHLGWFLKKIFHVQSCARNNISINWTNRLPFPPFFIKNVIMWITEEKSIYQWTQIVLTFFLQTVASTHYPVPVQLNDRPCHMYCKSHDFIQICISKYQKKIWLYWLHPLFICNTCLTLAFTFRLLNFNFLGFKLARTYFFKQKQYHNASKSSVFKCD